ncbi:MAG: signal peptidase I [Planctomycetes bacterium]|nr:signal peptidase I [Planctomycetota bacterium]
MHDGALPEPAVERADPARSQGSATLAAARVADGAGAPADDAALPSRGERRESLASLFALPEPSARALESERLFLEPPVVGARDHEPAVPHYNALQRAVIAVRSFLRTRVSIAFLAQGTLAFAVAHFLLFNLSVVRGSSMQPGIHDGDRIVIDPWAYVFGSIERGDVVVLKYPLDPHVDYIKRVIGLPGDEIVIEAGRVWVNGEALDEPYVADEDPLSRLVTRVKPAHYFVLGDNRPRSSDSRDFGQVPEEYVRGRVEVRLWPIDRAGAVR